MTRSPAGRRMATRMAVVLGSLVACASPAAAQARHTPEPVTVLVVADSTARQPRNWLSSLTRDQRGRIYLAAWGAPAAVFAPGTRAGSYLLTASGHAPLASSISWLGDTLAVGGLDTWQLFGPDGTPLECRPFEQMNNEFATQVFPLQALAGGWTLGERTPAYPDPRFPESLVVSRGQTVVRTLHQRPSGPDYVDVPFPWGGGATSVMVPYTARTLWAASDDGAHVVVAESEQPAGPGPHPVRVLRMGVDGAIVYDARLLLPTRPVRDDERERQIDAWARGMAGGTIPRDTAAARRAFRETIRFPAYHPAVTEALVARDGTAWLRLPDEDDKAVWMRLGADGAELPRLVVDGSFGAAHADADALWGALRAPDGTLRVVAYPLPGRPPLFPAGFAGFERPTGPPSPPPVILKGTC